MTREKAEALIFCMTQVLSGKGRQTESRSRNKILPTKCGTNLFTKKKCGTNFAIRFPWLNKLYTAYNYALFVSTFRKCNIYSHYSLGLLNMLNSIFNYHSFPPKAYGTSKFTLFSQRYLFMIQICSVKVFAYHKPRYLIN